MKTAILSNANLDMLIGMMGKKDELFRSAGYGQWQYYAIASDERLSLFNPQIIFILLDGRTLVEPFSESAGFLAELDTDIRIVKTYCEKFRETMVIVSDLDFHFNYHFSLADSFLSFQEKWQTGIKQLMQRESNLNVFPLAELIQASGREAFYSDKMWYMGSIPYSLKGTDLLAEALRRYEQKSNGVPKKVLVVDLDNTLWGGVVGEDGPEGVVLGNSLKGAIYRDVQRELKHLQEQGVLLAVVSKNNPEDVDALFQKNQQMVLKKGDFVEIVTNWTDKPTNIRNLAKALNLGMESFVFLDDNEIEREQVRRQLPMVSIVDFPKDIASLPSAVSQLSDQYFWHWRVTHEDAHKTEEYKAEQQRQEMKSHAASMDDFIGSLEMVVRIQEAKGEQTDRIVQLMNKTNQFNTNTLRMELGSYRSFLKGEGNHVYVANVQDKYGDNGLVAILVVRQTGNEAEVLNFLMSCRVMGRKVEEAVLFATENALLQVGCKILHASYVQSAKNKPVENLWDGEGFTLTGEANGIKKYEKHLEPHPLGLLPMKVVCE